MADYRTKLSFMVELTQRESEFAERLLQACNAVIERASWEAGASELDAIYTDPDVVPADLFEYVKRIEPHRFGSTGIAASYEDESDGEEAGLWVRDDESANTEFVAAWLRELICEFGHPEVIGFEWCYDCSRPILHAYGGGACLVTKDQSNRLDTGDWLCEKTADPDGRVATKVIPILRQLLAESERALEAHHGAAMRPSAEGRK